MVRQAHHEQFKFISNGSGSPRTAVAYYETAQSASLSPINLTVALALGLELNIRAIFGLFGV